MLAFILLVISLVVGTYIALCVRARSSLRWSEVIIQLGLKIASCIPSQWANVSSSHGGSPARHARIFALELLASITGWTLSVFAPLMWLLGSWSVHRLFMVWGITIFYAAIRRDVFLGKGRSTPNIAAGMLGLGTLFTGLDTKNPVITFSLTVGLAATAYLYGDVIVAGLDALGQRLKRS